MAYTYAETEATQFDVMAEMRDKHKVQVKRWSDKDLAAFEKAWLEVIQEESAKDPLFKKVADHYLDYRKKYAIWGDAQVMKPTYLEVSETHGRRSQVLRRPAPARIFAPADGTTQQHDRASLLACRQIVRARERWARRVTSRDMPERQRRWSAAVGRAR